MHRSISQAEKNWHEKNSLYDFIRVWLYRCFKSNEIIPSPNSFTFKVYSTSGIDTEYCTLQVSSDGNGVIYNPVGDGKRFMWTGVGRDELAMLMKADFALMEIKRKKGNAKRSGKLSSSI